MEQENKIQSINERWGVSDERTAQMQQIIDETYAELTGLEGGCDEFTIEYTILTRINPINPGEYVVSVKRMRDVFWLGSDLVKEQNGEL